MSEENSQLKNDNRQFRELTNEHSMTESWMMEVGRRKREMEGAREVEREGRGRKGGREEGREEGRGEKRAIMHSQCVCWSADWPLQFAHWADVLHDLLIIMPNLQRISLKENNSKLGEENSRLRDENHQLTQKLSEMEFRLLKVGERERKACPWGRLAITICTLCYIHVILQPNMLISECNHAQACTMCS